MWNNKKTLYYETINRITRKNYNPKTILAMIQTNANNKDAKVFIFNDRQEAEKATIDNIQFQEQQKDQRFATQTLLVNLNHIIDHDKVEELVDNKDKIIDEFNTESEEE